ncbi:MAG TPA: ABC transporter permease [Acidimicrobiales bacterium]|nr:ABC transporter permease [Acidimicrobiales bacterium]
MATRDGSVISPDHSLIYDSDVRRSAVRGSLYDLYRYRALVRLLVARDLTVRYKRSLLGVTWTVLNPLLTSLVMWVVFSHLFHSKIPGNVPFLVYLLAGNLVATYFQQGITMTSASLTSSASLLTKVYVPPAVFAFSAACGGAINLLFGLVPLFIFQLWLGTGIAWTAIALPVLLLFMLAMIAGVGLSLSTFAILYDDVLQLVAVLLMLAMYLSAVFYPISIVPAQFRQLFYLNPLYSYVNVFRFLVYGGPRPSWLSFVIIVATGVVGLSVGLAIFTRRWPKVAVLL